MRFLCISRLSAAKMHFSRVVVALTAVLLTVDATFIIGTAGTVGVGAASAGIALAGVAGLALGAATARIRDSPLVCAESTEFHRTGYDTQPCKTRMATWSAHVALVLVGVGCHASAVGG